MIFKKKYEKKLYNFSLGTTGQQLICNGWSVTAAVMLEANHP